MSEDASGTTTTGGRAIPGLDLDALETWLSTNAPELLTGTPLSATIIAGGRSNLTYALDGAREPLVLRRPPLGHVQKTAHDMAREFRVISALADSAVPVPRTVLFIDDASAGVEMPCYLMQRVEGRALKSQRDNADFTGEQLTRLSHDLARVLAKLHTIDPATVGLADFGRPEGFLVRQLDRWGRQYEGSRNRDLPELDALQRELGERFPETLYTSIVHGDFRLDNALVAIDAAGEPHIQAVLDWEMATLGDSLTDLGLFGLYWDINSFEGMPQGVVATSVAPGEGYPPFAELIEVYADTAGIEIPDMSWYLAFAAFKLAVILEGIHYRYQAGQTVGEGFEHMGSIVLPLARAGRRYLTGEA
ncbi:phosphotransferase family protein [Salinibacterium sp. SYSU T00001]|uniref:phosphotransferase family protein n=1 Tax=Homoserinimonas sedimenticola TaxID=2986805 RepID=UPI0022360E7D|nr:phosphotransferase family protein [Salinibacterium sedimenticola]MCW4386048.1 phosphotransferase family protein [Salinibacterium sedimenticola]